jgi:hypothetical protein
MTFDVVPCIHVVVVAVIAESGIQGVKNFETCQRVNVSTTCQRSGHNVEGNCIRRYVTDRGMMHTNKHEM